MRNIIRPAIVIVALSFLIIAIWLRSGLLISGGESGIPFYHLYNTAGYISHAWSDGILGLPTSYSVGNYFAFVFLSLFQTIKIPSYLIQAVVFFLILLTGNVYIFLVTRKSTPKVNSWFSIGAVLFYIFNLISIVSIWNRLQYPFIFFYAFLPLGCFLYMKGLEEKKLSNVIVINIAIVVFSFAFTSIPTLELLWFFFLLYLLFHIILHWREKEKVLHGILFFILLLITWVLFNSWWLLQFLSSFTASSYTAQGAYTSGVDIGTFKTLSDRLGNLSYLFRLMHKDFFTNITPVWKGIYANFFMTLSTFLIPFLAFLPLTIKTKPRYLYFFLGFSLIILFLMKGSAAPFGGLFFFLFSHVRLLEAFRNPFEKFSLLLPFGYAPLLAYSLFVIYAFLKNKKGMLFSKITIFFLLLIMVSISFPILNRWVFTSTSKPTNNLSIGYYTQVPYYYKTANDWLNSDSEQFRVIALPIDGEGITYTWKFGYSGVELSNGLFDKPFISFSPTTQFLGNITGQLQYTLFRNPQYISLFLSLLNAKYIMIRSDIDYVEREMENPKTISALLERSSGSNIPNLIVSKAFGKLQFFRNLQFLPLIYPVSSFHLAPTTLLFADVMELSNFKNGEMILNPDKNQPPASFPSRPQTTILSPNTAMIMNSSSFPILSLHDALQQLFIPHTMPTSFAYPVLRFKENVESYFMTDQNDLFFRYVLLSQKRLGELIALIENNNLPKSQKASEDYISALEVLNSYKNTMVEQDNIYYFRSSLIAEQLILKDVLGHVATTQAPILKNTLDYIEQFFLENGVKPLFSPQETINSPDARRAIYDFSISSPQQYELLLKHDEFDSTIAPLHSIKKIQIDDVSQAVYPIEEGNWISFGSFQMGQGKHEVQFSIPTTSNLISDTKNTKFTLSSGGTTSISKKIELRNIDPYSTYRVSFDYWVQKGNLARVALTNDLETRTHQISSYKSFGADGYNNDFQSRSFEYQLNPSTMNHFVIFTVDPYNNCAFINSKNPLLALQCSKDKSFYNQFGKPTILQINNLKVEKIFTNKVVLRNTNRVQKFVTLPTVQFKMINPSHYEIHVSNAQKPFYLVLSESFHPLWKLTFEDKTVDLNHYLVNSYANAWYVNRLGTYTLNLEFSPEEDFIIGKLISGVSLFVSVVYLCFRWWKKKYG